MHTSAQQTRSENVQGHVYSSDILQPQDTTSYSFTHIFNINVLPKDGCNCYGKTSTADQQTDQWEYQYDTKSSQEALHNVVPQTIDMSCHAFTNETCNK